MPTWRKLQLAALGTIALAVAAVLANTALPGNNAARLALGLGGLAFVLVLISRFVKGLDDAREPGAPGGSEPGTAAVSKQRAAAHRSAATPAPVFERVDSSARKQQPAQAPPVAPLLAGWIATRESDVDVLAARVSEHAQLAEPEAPVEIEVILERRADGTLDVVFAGVPVYEFVNLVGWLEAVDSQLELVDGEVLRLAPLPDDPFKDRIAGGSTTTDRVEVYLPEAELIRKGRGAAAVVESPERSEVARYVITADASAFCAGKGWPGPAIPAPFDGLARDPSAALGTLYTPDPERIEIPIAEIEAHGQGRLVFSTTEWQDQWLLVHRDGSWTELQLSDGVHDRYPTSTHLAVELFVRAIEEPHEDDALVAMATALGLPRPADLLKAFQPHEDESYGDFRARFLDLVLGLEP